MPSLAHAAAGTTPTGSRARPPPSAGSRRLSISDAGAVSATPGHTPRVVSAGWAAAMQTSLVAFHESFWVVAGTAAPVIALAVIVSLRDVLRDFTDDYNMTWVRPGVGDQAARAKLENELGEAAYVRNLAYGAAALNMLLQMVILTLALVSLAKRHDVIPWLIMAIIVPGGLALLLLSTLMVVMARSLRQQVMMEADELDTDS
jgi:hypothetical protein